MSAASSVCVSLRWLARERARVYLLPCVIRLVLLSVKHILLPSRTLTYPRMHTHLRAQFVGFIYVSDGSGEDSVEAELPQDIRRARVRDDPSYDGDLYALVLW